MAADTLPGRTALGAAAAEWSATHRIDVDGVRVRYRSAGSGVPVVLVHGLGVSADYWVRNAPIIAASGYRVLAPDLPGFGRTRGPAEGLDVPAQAEALRRWAAALDLPPAVYLGHSLSCQAVLELAAREPDMVRGLILVAPTGQDASVRRLLRQGIGFLRDIRHESVKLASIIALAYLRAGPKRVLRTWHMGAKHDPLPLLPRIRCRALILLGELDPVVPFEFARNLADGLPRSNVVVVPRGSHGVIFDKTGAFNGAVLDFLKEM